MLQGASWEGCGLSYPRTHTCLLTGWFSMSKCWNETSLCVWRAGKGSLMVCDQRVMSSCGVAVVFFVPDVKGHTQCAFVIEQPWLCLTGKWECLRVYDTQEKCINVNNIFSLEAHSEKQCSKCFMHCSGCVEFYLYTWTQWKALFTHLKQVMSSPGGPVPQ